MRTPRREAGRLINQTVTLRTITPSRHSRTGITASLLHLSTTTELLVINLVPHQSGLWNVILPPLESSAGPLPSRDPGP